MKREISNFSAENLSAYDVYLAYRLLLGREPESDQVIKDHLLLKSLEGVRNAMINSGEFRSQFMRWTDFGKKWVSTEVLDEFTMWVDLSDRHVSRGCLNNNWEASETNYFAAALPNAEVVLDIGANIGWFSLLAIKYMNPKGIVHAFEPNLAVASKLKRTIKDNALENRVKVWNLALSDKAEDLYICWGKETDNPGGAHLSHKQTDSSMVYQMINAVALDDMLPDLKPDLIKMDVEGAEPRVVRGAKHMLRKYKPTVLSELHPLQLKKVSNSNATQYIFQMTELGYQCFLLEDGKPTKKLKDFPSDCNSDLVSVVFERMN
jgi:FkbM family methyltransferase